ncbi:MAG: acetate--CoA ligase family protein, partial [Acidimicrobiia bacterium]
GRTAPASGDPAPVALPEPFRLPHGEDDAKRLLAQLGVGSPARLACTTRAEARRSLGLLRSPLAVKMLDPVVAHKSRVGGVRLGVCDDAGLTEALDALDAAGARRYLVEEMAPPGFDLIVGARRDPVFGSVVCVGLGGDAAEELATVAVRLAPIGERAAAAMLGELPGAGHLRGTRLPRIVALLGGLLDAVPELGEVEINPLRALPDGRLVALDVVVSAVAEVDATDQVARPDGSGPLLTAGEVRGGS